MYVFVHIMYGESPQWPGSPSARSNVFTPWEGRLSSDKHSNWYIKICIFKESLHELILAWSRVTWLNIFMSSG